MANVPTPVSKASVDPNYENRLRDLKTAAAAEAAARSRGEPVAWDRPAGWNGDVFDFAGFAPPYAADKATADYLAAVSDPASPGTPGDVVATTTMLDYLAVMERAFRVRHMTRPRAVAHAIGRKAGHGSDTGPIVQAGLESVRRTLRQAKVQ
jgi:hypothetical protein